MKKSLIGKLIVLTLIMIMIVMFIQQRLEQDQRLTGSNYEVDLSEKQVLEKGETAPDFELTTLDGETVRLSDFKGQKVVLNFWATWCPPCKVEMPHFQEYEEKHAAKENVVLLAANLTYKEKNVDLVESFVNSRDITFPILMMDNDRLVRTYEVLTMPSTFFIDTDGKLQRQMTGAIDLKQLKAFVKELD